MKSLKHWINKYEKRWIEQVTHCMVKQVERKENEQEYSLHVTRHEITLWRNFFDISLSGFRSPTFFFYFYADYLSGKCCQVEICGNMVNPRSIHATIVELIFVVSTPLPTPYAGCLISITDFLLIAGITNTYMIENFSSLMNR